MARFLALLALLVTPAAAPGMDAPKFSVEFDPDAVTSSALACVRDPGFKLRCVDLSLFLKTADEFRKDNLMRFPTITRYYPEPRSKR